MLDFQIQPFAQVFRAMEQELNQNTPNKAVQSWWSLEEDDKAYYLLIDTPGMEKEALDIEMNGKDLLIKWSNVQSARKVVGGRTRATEFEHRFKVSDQVDTERIQANHKNGVLELVLPKRELSVSRKISISDPSLSGDNLKN